MNNNTLRFGVVRALAFGGLLVVGAWAGKASAEPPTLLAEAQASIKAELAVELKASVQQELWRDLVRDIDSVDAATRNDLITKAAAAASVAPRGFDLLAPALIVAPAQ